MTDSVSSPLAAPAHEAPWLATAAELAAEFSATAAELDESGEIPVENLRAIHAAGLDEAVLPVPFGGQGLSFRAFGEIVRMLSAAEPSTACIWLMHIGAAVGLVKLSAPEVGQFYAAELRAGRTFANALSEPASGNLFLLPQQVGPSLPMAGTPCPARNVSSPAVRSPITCWSTPSSTMFRRSSASRPTRR